MNMNNRVDKLVTFMRLGKTQAAIQRAQSKHRLKLIDFWGIEPGSKVLEIGCGQGDTTAALAYVLGEGGFVHGIDIAPPDYGAPETLGEARTRLLQSPLGKSIKMDFDTDVLSPQFKVNMRYDYVVLAHCSWYFTSAEVLQKLFARVRQFADKLCFCEWDIQAQMPAQLAHFYAALIQAQCACFEESGGNIRTLLSKADFESIAQASGWNAEKSTSFCSPDLQDAAWEVEYTQSEYAAIIASIENMPAKMKELLISQLNVLKNMGSDIVPLNTYAFVAN